MKLFRSALASTVSLVSTSSRSLPQRVGRHGAAACVAAAMSTTSGASSSSSSSSSSFTSHSSMSELMDRYDAFILDQFGVLHNGVAALDGAIDCLENMYQAGKKIIILSNTSAPSDKALLKLRKLGFNPQHITTGAVTSGEEASRYIRQVYGGGGGDSESDSDDSGGNANGGPPCKVLMLTWDTIDLNNPRLTALPTQFLEQCGNVVVAKSVEEADLLLLHGSEVWYRGDVNAATSSDDVGLGEESQISLSPFITTGSLETVDPILIACSQRRLPMVCANPDNIVRTPDGQAAHMPGTLAERYMQLIRQQQQTFSENNNDAHHHSAVIDCRVFGKPHAEHFQACLDKLMHAHGIEPHRVAHVGDSLHHDIAGAAGAGVASVWTTSSGIHANDLDLAFGELPTKEQVEELLGKEGTPVPTHVLPAFIW